MRCAARFCNDYGIDTYFCPEDSHNFILDEIIRRDRLEYDPMRAYAGEEEEDKIESGNEN